jgi:hyperosmotically inducible protein
MKNQLTRSIFALAAFACATVSAADADQVKAASKAAYYAAGDKAAADYMDAHAHCETLDASMQAVCIEEAKLTQTRAKGIAEVQYRNTAQARLKASIDVANAEYRVAEAKCQSHADNEKKFCIRQANALRSVAIANAKAGQK